MNNFTDNTSSMSWERIKGLVRQYGPSFILVFTIVLVFMGSLTPIVSDDTFMNLTLGRHLLSEGSLPVIDPYIFSIPSHHWHVWHEWIAYAYYYLIYLAGGLSGVILSRAIALSLLAALFWRFARFKKATPPFVISAVILVIFIVAFERCRADRASFIGDAILTLLILALLTIDRIGHIGKWIWIFPLIFVFWVNTHPSYPLGWGFIGLFIMFRYRRWTVSERTKWLAVLTTCVLVTLLNPLGLKGAIYPLRAFFISDFGRFKEINSEWVPIFFSHLFLPDMKWRVGLFLAFGTLISAIGLRRKAWFEFVGTLVLVYFCTSAVRFVAIAAFGIGVFVLNELTTWNWKGIGRRALPVVALYPFIVIAFLYYHPALGAWWPFIFLKGGKYLPDVPIGAVMYMSSLPPGNVFNEYTAGGLIAWELKGHMKVAGHGHIDSPTLAINHYWRFSESPQNFREIVGDGNVDYFLVYKSELEKKREFGWVQELHRHWLKIYADDNAVIFKRLYNYKTNKTEYK